jgi:hypothetical protein
VGVRVSLFARWPGRIEPGTEVKEKVWARLTLGMLQLDAGATRLVLRAPEIPGGQACDVRAVELRRLD